METNKKNDENVLGTEVKKQKVSKSYTVKQFGEMVTKIEGFGYLNEGEVKHLKGMQVKVKEAYIKEAFG